MVKAICERILKDQINNNPHFDYILRIELFKEYFNPLIHAQGIYWGNPEQHDQYNMFFGLVRTKVSAWLKRKKGVRDRAQKMQIPKVAYKQTIMRYSHKKFVDNKTLALPPRDRE
ncbi:MAG: hypothetical protein WAV46_00875 [Candidatus Moraniibacteriota bacterium]